MKNKTIYAFAVICIVCVGCWLSMRWSAISSLEREMSAGLDVRWKDVWGTPWAPGSTLSRLQINYNMISPEKLAHAIKHFGGVETININHGDQRTIAFLSELGELNGVISLQIFDAPFADNHLKDMRFPSVNNIAFVNCLVTAETFTDMPELKVADLGGSPISDKGLRNILKLKKLEHLTLEAADITPNGLLDAASVHGDNMLRLQLSNYNWSQEMLDELNTSFNRKGQKIQVSW